MEPKTILKAFEVTDIINNDMRTFECWGSVETKDRHGEIIPAEEVYKIMDIWMDRGAPIQFNHTNRNVGRGLNWQPLEKNGRPGVLIKAKIHNHYKEDDELWQDIKKGEFEGLSIGGKSYNREESEDGTILRGLIGYEFSIVKRCGNQEATFVGVNQMAKSEETNKSKVSLKPGQEPPKGAKVFTGPRGGKYYESKPNESKVMDNEKVSSVFREAQDDTWSQEIYDGLSTENNSYLVTEDGDYTISYINDSFLNSLVEEMENKEIAEKFKDSKGKFALYDVENDKYKLFSNVDEAKGDIENSAKKMAKSEEIKKEEPVMDESPETEQKEEDQMAQLQEAIASLAERLNMIEERISGAPQEEEAVEEQKEEEEEPEMEKEEEEPEEEEKEYDEDEMKKSLESENQKLKAEIAQLKKSSIKNVIKSERPAVKAKKEDKYTDIRKSLKEMSANGKIDFATLGKAIRGQ